MAAPGVTVTGVAEVTATLERIATAAATTPPDAASALASGIELAAPYVTGELRGSISAAGGEVIIGAPYALIVNARTGYIATGTAASEAAIVSAWESHIDGITQREGAR